MRTTIVRCDGCGEVILDGQIRTTIHNAAVTVAGCYQSHDGSKTTTPIHQEMKGTFEFCTVPCIESWLRRELKYPGICE